MFNLQCNVYCSQYACMVTFTGVAGVVMVQSTSFDEKRYISNNSLNGDQMLQDLMRDTEFMLAKLEKGLTTRYLGFARNRYEGYTESWKRVSSKLNYFLEAPEQRYTPFIGIINTEIHRFPSPQSPYVKQLIALKALIAAGPRFDQKFHISPR